MCSGRAAGCLADRAIYKISYPSIMLSELDSWITALISCNTGNASVASELDDKKENPRRSARLVNR